ncbi:MAG TPA: hypothetical protein VMW15_04425 [Terracidiphilus sp.]|jgi:hypothetical protein|nr:hypothetical protein [Terracidiphilus sp.]HUX27948.1 hypothetical protein [Terracidiphilus sp.]
MLTPSAGTCTIVEDIVVLADTVNRRAAASESSLRQPVREDGSYRKRLGEKASQAR